MTSRCVFGRLTAFAACLTIGAAAGSGFGLQPQARTAEAEPADGLVAQVRRLQREVENLRAELYARKVAYYGISALTQIRDGWTSQPVPLKVRNGDTVRITVNFDAISQAGDTPPAGFYWEIIHDGRVKERDYGNSKIAHSTTGRQWRTQANTVIYTAFADGIVNFSLHASKGDLTREGEMRSLTVIAENLVWQ